jgi:hypothetical protein
MAIARAARICAAVGTTVEAGVGMRPMQRRS